MNKDKQKDIINYVLGTICMPVENRQHIEAMVILHFDVTAIEAQ